MQCDTAQGKCGPHIIAGKANILNNQFTNKDKTNIPGKDTNITSLPDTIVDAGQLEKLLRNIMPDKTVMLSPRVLRELAPGGC